MLYVKESLVPQIQYVSCANTSMCRIDSTPNSGCGVMVHLCFAHGGSPNSGVSSQIVISQVSRCVQVVLLRSHRIYVADPSCQAEVELTVISCSGFRSG